MALFNRYPYTNGHELNLDWILKKIQKLPTKVSQLINDSGYLTMDTVPVKSVNNQTGEVFVASLDDIAVINDKIGHSITAMGNPAVFYTENPKGSFTKLLVSMEPVQSGSGDPSPTNVRPITGFTGITIRNSESADEYDVEFPTAAGTVAMGTLDLVSRELTVDRQIVVFDGTQTDFGFMASTAVNRISWSGYMSIGLPGDAGIPFISDKLKTAPNVYSGFQNIPWCVYNAKSASAARMFITVPTTIASKDDFVSYCANDPITVVYPLAEPQTYYLTVPQIKALMGTNSLTVDNGVTIDLIFTTGINGAISNIATTRPVVKIGTIAPSTSFINSGELYLLCNSSTCELYFNDNNVIKQIT